MNDDVETGAEHDTFDSNQPDRDRETAQGARRPEPGAPSTRQSPAPEKKEPREPDQR